MDTLGERIRKRREELDLTQEQVAAYVGVSGPAVSQWELGQTKNLKNHHLFKLADILKLNPKYLGIGQGPKKVAASVLIGLGTLIAVPPSESQAHVFNEVSAIYVKAVYYVKSLFARLTKLNQLFKFS